MNTSGLKRYGTNRQGVLMQSPVEDGPLVFWADVQNAQRAVLHPEQIADLATRCGVKGSAAALLEFADLVREAEPMAPDEMRPAPVAEPVDDERDRVLEEAAKVAEDTDVVTFTQAMVLHDDGAQTRANIAKAIRALKGSCTLPPAGWRCTRGAGHEGPCAAWPTEPATACGGWTLERYGMRGELCKVYDDAQKQISEGYTTELKRLVDAHNAQQNAVRPANHLKE